MLFLASENSSTCDIANGIIDCDQPHDTNFKAALRLAVA